jgi:hypothetical protein
MIRQITTENIAYAVSAPRWRGSGVRETRNVYVAPVKPDRAVCFLCGHGSEAGALEGSGHTGDCVHLDCLARQPFDWDAAAS